MSAVLTQQVEGRPDFQAAVPGLRRFGKDFQLPFRNDGPFTTTMAFVSHELQVITAIARDNNGNEMCRTQWAALAGEHEAFIVSDRLPCTDGQTGVLELAPQFDSNLIAFLFNDFGAFTTQLPYEICCREP